VGCTCCHFTSRGTMDHPNATKRSPITSESVSNASASDRKTSTTIGSRRENWSFFFLLVVALLLLFLFPVPDSFGVHCRPDAKTFLIGAAPRGEYHRTYEAAEGAQRQPKRARHHGRHNARKWASALLQAFLATPDHADHGTDAGAGPYLFDPPPRMLYFPTRPCLTT
jgi:hypothetical protein